MSWVRLHSTPNSIKKIHNCTARYKYYFTKSYNRYLLTEDGKYLSQITVSSEEGIGSISNFRFVKSTLS